MIVGTDLDKLPAEKKRFAKKVEEVFNSEILISHRMRDSERKMATISVESLLQQFTM